MVSEQEETFEFRPWHKVASGLVAASALAFLASWTYDYSANKDRQVAACNGFAAKFMAKDPAAHRLVQQFQGGAEGDDRYVISPSVIRGSVLTDPTLVVAQDHEYEFDGSNLEGGEKLSTFMSHFGLASWAIRSCGAKFEVTRPINAGPEAASIRQVDYD